MGMHGHAWTCMCLLLQAQMDPSSISFVASLETFASLLSSRYSLRLRTAQTDTGASIKKRRQQPCYAQPAAAEERAQQESLAMTASSHQHV